MVSTPSGVSHQGHGIGKGRPGFWIPGSRANRGRLISDQGGCGQRDDRIQPEQGGGCAADAQIVPLTRRVEPEMSPCLFKGGLQLPALDEPRQELQGIEIQRRRQQRLRPKFSSRII